MSISSYELFSFTFAGIPMSIFTPSSSWRLRRLALIAVLLPVFLVSCKDDPVDPPDVEIILTPEVKAILQKKLDSARLAAGIPGASIALQLPDGEEWYTTVGYMDLSSAPNTATAGDSMEVDAQFRIGSITKTFTATVILQLIDEDKLKLDDKVTDVLPDFEPKVLNDVDMDTVTVYQLLTHTSSIQNYTNSVPWTLTYLEKPLRNWTPQELIDTANTLGAATPNDYAPYPWMYANTNYIILGLMIEKLTGRPAGEEITDRIITPLGMTNSYFALTFDPRNASTFSRGYSDFTCTPYNVAPIPGKGDAFYDITILNPSQGWTAGSMVATTRDLMVFLNALVDGTMISAEMQTARTRDMWQAGKDGAEGWYGLGIAKIGGTNNGILGGWVGHKGGFNGYDLSMYKKPSEAALIVLTNIGGTSCSVNTGGPVLFKVITEYLFGESPEVRAFDSNENVSAN